MTSLSNLIYRSVLAPVDDTCLNDRLRTVAGQRLNLKLSHVQQTNSIMKYHEKDIHHASFYRRGTSCEVLPSRPLIYEKYSDIDSGRTDRRACDPDTQLDKRRRIPTTILHNTLAGTKLYKDGLTKAHLLVFVHMHNMFIYLFLIYVMLRS